MGQGPPRTWNVLLDGNSVGHLSRARSVHEFTHSELYPFMIRQGQLVTGFNKIIRISCRHPINTMAVLTVPL